MSFPAANCICDSMAASGMALAGDEAARSRDDAISALTRRLVAGEDAAWREFHDRYFDRLMRYLLVVCRGDEHAAREHLQAAMTRIVRHVRQFDREEAWWSWLTVVVRSCVVDGARRQSRYRSLLDRFAGFSGLPISSAVEDPLPGLLEECLRKLPQAERDLLMAKYHEGQPTVALAESLGCTPKAIESRLARLRQRIKTELLQRLRHEN
jgi:RNA polymerase sigma factor (sigma-70 family)